MTYVMCKYLLTFQNAFLFSLSLALPVFVKANPETTYSSNQSLKQASTGLLKRYLLQQNYTFAQFAVCLLEFHPVSVLFNWKWNLNETLIEKRQWSQTQEHHGVIVSYSV